MMKGSCKPTGGDQVSLSLLPHQIDISCPANTCRTQFRCFHDHTRMTLFTPHVFAWWEWTTYFKSLWGSGTHIQWIPQFMLSPVWVWLCYLPCLLESGLPLNPIMQNLQGRSKISTNSTPVCKHFVSNLVTNPKAEQSTVQSHTWPSVMCR